MARWSLRCLQRSLSKSCSLSHLKPARGREGEGGWRGSPGVSTERDELAMSIQIKPGCRLDWCLLLHLQFTSTGNLRM